MKEFQKKKLKELFEYLDVHNKYYHELFIKNEIDLTQDGDKILSHMPILSKTEIRKNGMMYFSDSNEAKVRELTSGSVGVPLTC